LIVGLGQLGLPVAKYVKERGFETYGYDVNPKTMDFAEQTAAIKKAGNFGDIEFDYTEPNRSDPSCVRLR
jgi:UDP-N-acetyl-D-mannosaminuronic acid dehydrogenase